MTAPPPPDTTTPVRLNLGCGRNSLPGWTNVDVTPLPGVDVVADLASCREVPLPFADDSVDEFLLSHVLEHVRDPLGLMAELHRIARPNALMVVRVPHGASDDAVEDPTHVRQMFPGSFGYFSQPYYWRADYGYRGDWLTDRITLYVGEADNAGLPIAAILEKINRQRNVVSEMVAELRAVKPIREPLQSLQTAPRIVIAWG